MKQKRSSQAGKFHPDAQQPTDKHGDHRGVEPFLLHLPQGRKRQFLPKGGYSLNRGATANITVAGYAFTDRK
jgi:hypothetical protein